MEQTVELPSGATAVWRDPLTVTNGERKAALQASTRKGLQEADTTEQLGAIDMFVSLMVRSWSHPFQVPSADPSSLDRLPALDLDRLRDFAMKPGNLPILDTSISPDPKAPSASSGISSGESPRGTWEIDSTFQTNSGTTT